MPGNHEYVTPHALPYFEYFGERVGGPQGEGYYSFEVGDWHAVALNSNIAAGPGSAQATWLRTDLASSRARCTIAYWHHPLFTSGPNGDMPSMRELWRILYDARAEIVMSAHEHMYERFGPQDPDGHADPARGIRQFVVGTGGAFLSQPRTLHPNSERPHQLVRRAEADAVVRSISVGVRSGGGGSTSDGGSGVCH